MREVYLGLLVWAMFGVFLAAGQAPSPPIREHTTSNRPALSGTSETPVAPLFSRERTGGGGASLFGNDLPVFDPASNTVVWNGQRWNVTDNAIFRARFEKYLSSPPQTTRDDVEYQAIIDGILEKLAPRVVNQQRFDEAWAMLPEASAYRMDENLADSLALAIYNVWLAKREINRMRTANILLERKMDRLQSRLESAARDPELRARNQEDPETRREQRELRLNPYKRKIAEAEAAMKSNEASQEATLLKAKVEFQSLIVGFFLQRRFQHALMGIRFYQNMFGDGDMQLRVGEEVRRLFAQVAGDTPTLLVVDMLANAAIAEVKDAVDTYKYLSGRQEMQSASQRLMEVFIVGEYLAPIKTLTLEEKRAALDFIQAQRRLEAAMHVRDFLQVDQVLKEISAMARDFITTEAEAMIQAGKMKSRSHLMKAKNYMLDGDTARTEEELKLAMEAWPTNPELEEVSQTLLGGVNKQQQALIDLQRLLREKNYRQIAAESSRFAFAAFLKPEIEPELRAAIEQVTQIDLLITQARKIAEVNPYAAWEEVERRYPEFTTDRELSHVRSELAVGASEFVRRLQEARALSERGQLGSALAAFLEARRLFPSSVFVKEGLEAVSKRGLEVLAASNSDL